jgi:hypothetical protein
MRIVVVSAGISRGRIDRRLYRREIAGATGAADVER